MLRIDARVERSQRVVREAAIAELAEGGWGAFTIGGVAARAGVARSTVYRHWRDKRALILDALEHHSIQPPPDGTAPGRPRVVELVRHLAEVMADPDRSAVVPALIEASQQDPVLGAMQRRFSERRGQALASALADAGAANPTMTAMALAGAVVYARVMGGGALDPGRAEELVEAVLGPEVTSSRRRQARAH